MEDSRRSDVEDVVTPTTSEYLFFLFDKGKEEEKRKTTMRKSRRVQHK